MKKLLVVLTALAFVVGFSAVSFAVITGSEHDFSNQPFSQGQICLVCHTPHNAVPSSAVLWNHEVSTANYVLYSSATLDATDLNQPLGVSKLCLSCHDGTVAIDSFGGNTGSFFIFGSNNVGTDLSDDHPISFTYDTNLAQLDGELFDPVTAPSGITGTSGGSISDEMLFGPNIDQLECASCHDVHNQFNNDELLLKPNGGSALCLTCHNK
jgi:predicted CXXCH cytochrome family protein